MVFTSLIDFYLNYLFQSNIFKKKKEISNNLKVLTAKFVSYCFTNCFYWRTRVRLGKKVVGDHGTTKIILCEIFLPWNGCFEDGEQVCDCLQLVAIFTLTSVCQDRNKVPIRCSLLSVCNLIASSCQFHLICSYIAKWDKLVKIANLLLLHKQKFTLKGNSH